MSITLSALQKQRRDTAANWTSANPTLLAGEIGIESDTNKIKIGTGSTAWTSLAYTPWSQLSAYPIVNADVASNAEIAVSKLADGTARQLLQTDAAGTGVEWASNIDVPGTLDVTGAATFDNNVIIQGDLTVNGTETIINTQTLDVEDKNIVIGKVTTPSDVTADGGGITLKGSTDKTISWIDATDAWTFSEHVNIASAKEYRIAGTKVLDATSLGSAVVSSSLTSVGTIGTGVWQGTAIADTYLATISTAAKVSNSATTATSANTNSAIVARDGSGNFSAGTITAALTGAASSNVLKAGDTMTGALVVPLASASAPSLTFTGDTNTGIYSPGADQLAVTTGGTGRLFIDSSGRLLAGTSTARSNFFGTTLSSVTQIEGTGGAAGRGALSVINNDVSNNPPYVLLGRSGAATLGSNAAVVSGSRLGTLTFHGADGTSFIEAATVAGEVDGTPGTNDMPGRLVFSTTADGASSPTERMRIDSTGLVTLAGPGIKFPATQVASADANTLDDYEEGTWTPAVQGSTTAGTATYATQTGQYTKIGNRVFFNLRIIYTGGTGTGNLRVGGLPFTSSSAMAGAVTNVIAENITGTALYVFVGSVGVNTTYVGIDQLPAGGGSAIATAYDAAGDISIAGQYFV